MADHAFRHQQVRSCTLGMWLLSHLPVFYPLLSGEGMGLPGIPPCITVHHLTHPNHNVPLCAPEESIPLMLRNLTGSPLAPQRTLACLSARLARKGGEEWLNPLPQLPSIIHIQLPINPPVLFFSDPPFNFHIYHFHISHYPIPFWYSCPSFSISFLFSALDTAFSLSKRFSTFL